MTSKHNLAGVYQNVHDNENAVQHFQTEGVVQLKEFHEINYILVAAIDFGSTYSGYAFSTRLSFETKPLDISCAVWSTRSFQSLKTATCVLFQPNKSFHSFGFDAENEYAGLVEEEKHQEWFFFRRFKMQLYKAKNLKWDMMLSAVDGKTLPALKVFSSCINYLKQQMLQQCSKQGLDIKKPDIRWVVTVPAIWNENAKQFMRKAAEMADIPGPQLFLALEAEAAALYCKYLPVDDLLVKPEDYIQVFTPSSKYMVLDIGGGTVDITIHEVQDDLKLNEVYMATGGDWGGLKVDEAFENLMCEIFGNEVYRKFKTDYPSDLLELQRSFEIKKRTIKPDSKDIKFTIPFLLLETFRKMYPNKSISDEISKHQNFKSDVVVKNDKLTLNNRLALSLFDDSLGHIQEHLQNLLTRPEVKGISAILIVGGYSECTLLYPLMKKKFPNKKIIIPNEASLAVLKGAVINGHVPGTITKRICRFSYGVAVSSIFQPGFHKEEYAFMAEGQLRCDNVFSKHLTKNQTVKLFSPGKTRNIRVVFRNQEALAIEVYMSTEENPLYVTDDSCCYLGGFHIDMTDTSRGLDRGVVVTMTIGGAELQVKAVDIYTQEKKIGYFDFIGTPTDQELEELLK